MAKIKRIHINQHHIKHNKHPEDIKPVMTIKCSGKTFIGQEVVISGESKVVYRPEHPLSCGAHVWIETKSDVYLDGKLVPFII
jgi:hypothetical protein